MGIKTKISYCDSTVNPTPTCSGCELFPDHCYAYRLSKRWGGKKGWPRDFRKFEFFDYRIERACAWSDLTGTSREDKPWLNGYPRIIFLNDLGDTFAPIAPKDWLLPHIYAMERSPHIWLLLTKWPERMVDFFSALGRVPNNFWLGTSVTTTDSIYRAKELLRLKRIASTLWISAEPLLADITQELTPAMCKHVDWVVAGGESGRGARPCHPDWLRYIRDWCLCWGIPFHFKQWGEWASTNDYRSDFGFTKMHEFDDGEKMISVGKKIAGHLLDGREWLEMPNYDRN